MQTKNLKIIVIGGGYAGMMATLRLSGKTKKMGVEVTLINGLDTFVERPRLPEVAVGKPLKSRAIEQMLCGTGARFRQGWVKSIDPQQQTVQVKMASQTESFAYDYLVIALGSQVDRSTIPGITQYAYSPDPVGPLASEALHTRLNSLDQKQRKVVVIGGGATGIEMVTEIKAAYPQLNVSLLTKGAAGTFKGERLQPHFKQALQQQAISLREHCSVTRITEQTVWIDQEPFPADCIIWAGGFRALPLAREAGLAVNHLDQVTVDPYLRSLSHPNIYAVGDAAFPVEDCGTPVRMALLPALVMGATAANNIINQLQGRTLRPLSFVWYGQGVTLGPNDAVGFNTYPADAPVGPIFRGRLALQVRNFFVWLLGSVLELERRWPGSFYWNGQRRYRQAQKRTRVAHD